LGLGLKRFKVGRWGGRGDVAGPPDRWREHVDQGHTCLETLGKGDGIIQRLLSIGTKICRNEYVLYRHSSVPGLSARRCSNVRCSTCTPRRMDGPPGAHRYS